MGLGVRFRDRFMSLGNRIRGLEVRVRVGCKGWGKKGRCKGLGLEVWIGVRGLGLEEEVKVRVRGLA